MQQVKRLNSVPSFSVISKFFEKIDYVDSFQIEKKDNDNVDDIVNQLFKMPQWVVFLMKARNSIVVLLGLKTENLKNKQVDKYYPIGSKAVLFTVIDRNDNEIIMGETDSHLNFRTSVLIDRTELNTYIYVTTIVKFNTIWGRIYFLPVKSFHRFIIRTSIKRLL